MNSGVISACTGLLPYPNCRIGAWSRGSPISRHLGGAIPDKSESTSWVGAFLFIILVCTIKTTAEDFTRVCLLLRVDRSVGVTTGAETREISGPRGRPPVPYGEKSEPRP